ncbi:unnamed protein product [Meganyctiphanes norvegica]|uniref:Uncharacterized protein n=1 Tax=Meganyctiphanes norvegica TaxID=48144 RepID=A0AAV2R2F2_MEGNR
MRIFSIQLLVLLAVVTPGISTRAFVDLCETLQRPGVIIPKTSMRLYVHQRQEVRCVLTDTRNLSSRDLTFTLRKKDQTTTESCTLNRMKNITVDHPQILNESTVAWNMSLTTPGIGLLSCMAGQETICTRDVRVGWPAQPPESLQCISHNLEILACSYTTYDNPLLLETMDYRLSVVNTDGNRRYENEFGDQYGCNKEGVYCWNTNVYVANKSFVHLRFDVAEYEPKVLFNFTLNHYEIVIPDPVENLTATEVEPLTIHVNMTVSESLTNLPQGIILRVIATPAEPCCDCFEHQEIFHYPNSNMRNLDVDISNFKVLLPNTQYLISAALRSGANLLNGQFKSVEQDNYSTPGDNYTAINQGVDWWSHNATTTLKTAATAPWSAPLMHSGAFQWIGENFYVYWQTLLPCHHNGKGFHYLAQLYQGTNRISFGNSEEGLINFKNISKSEKYRVETVSKNDIGSSSNLSTMVVSSDRPTLPDFTVVLRRPGPTQQENHSIYTLRWYDFHFNTTKSYTVFACLGGDIPPDNQEPCKGRLFWMDMNNLSSSVDKGDEVAVYIVNATLQEFGINNHQQQEEESVRFAVSKEAHNGTFSGMIWPTKCPGVQDISSENPKIPFKINTESETATVTWNITCPMPPIYASELQEMVLKYCQGNLTSLENCKGIRRNISKRELAEERLVISGLNSDAKYTIQLLAIYAHGNSSALMTFSTPPADLSWWIIALIVVGTITALISMIVFLFKARKIYAKTKEDLHRELNIPIPKECSTETKEKNRNHILDNTNGFIQTEDIYKKSNMNKSYCDSDQFEYSDDINAYKNSITSEIEVNAKNIKDFSPSAREISGSSQEVQVELNGMPSYIAVMSIPQLSQCI